MKILFRLLINAFGVLLVANIVPGISVKSFGTALLVAIVLAVLNVSLGVILKILTFPLTLVTFGLFLLVVNAFVFWAASFVKGFVVAGFLPALLGSLVVTAVSTLSKKLLEK